VGFSDKRTEGARGKIKRLAISTPDQGVAPVRLDVFRRALIEGDARNLLVLFLCPPRPVLFAPANRIHTLVALDYGGRLRHAVTTNIELSDHAEKVLSVLLERLNAKNVLGNTKVSCALVRRPPPLSPPGRAVWIRPMRSRCSMRSRRWKP